jgi:hypothetical protein
MTPEVTKTVLNKIIPNVWIENGPVLLYGPGIELAFRSTSYVYQSVIQYRGPLSQTPQDIKSIKMQGHHVIH